MLFRLLFVFALIIHLCFLENAKAHERVLLEPFTTAIAAGLLQTGVQVFSKPIFEGISSLFGGGGGDGSEEALEEIQKTLQDLLTKQDEILKELDYVRVTIEKTVVNESLKDAFALIYASFAEMTSFLNSIKNGNYTDEEIKKKNYFAITAKIQNMIPQASTRLSLSYEQYLDLLRDQLVQNRTDSFTYYLSISYAVERFSAAFVNAMYLFSFADDEYVYLDGVANETKGYNEELGKLKDQFVKLTNWIPLVIHLLTVKEFGIEDSGTVDNVPPEDVIKAKTDDHKFFIDMVIQAPVNSKFLTVGDVNEAREVILSSDHITLLRIVAPEGFDPKDPIVHIVFNDRGRIMRIAPKDASISINFGEEETRSYGWRIEACKSSPSPKESGDEMCLKNENGQYLYFGDEGLLMGEFDASNPNFYWQFVKVERCALLYPEEEMKGEPVKLCFNATSMATIEKDTVDISIKSIVNGADMTLTLNSETDGTSYEIPPGKAISVLAGEWTSPTSSVRLVSSCGLLFEEEDYKGFSYPVCESTTYTGNQWMKVKSVILPEGMTMNIYDTKDYLGNKLEITENTAKLNDYVYVISIELVPLA